MDVTLQFYVFLIHVFFILQIKETLNVSSSKKVGLEDERKKNALYHIILYISLRASLTYKIFV
jgi:hypothetical protein